jgi:hypothetical protein
VVWNGRREEISPSLKTSNPEHAETIGYPDIDSVRRTSEGDAKFRVQPDSVRFMLLEKVDGIG